MSHWLLPAILLDLAKRKCFVLFFSGVGGAGSVAGSAFPVLRSAGGWDVWRLPEKVVIATQSFLNKVLYFLQLPRELSSTLISFYSTERKCIYFISEMRDETYSIPSLFLIFELLNTKNSSANNADTYPCIRPRLFPILYQQIPIIDANGLSGSPRIRMSRRSRSSREILAFVTVAANKASANSLCMNKVGPFSFGPGRDN